MSRSQVSQRKSLECPYLILSPWRMTVPEAKFLYRAVCKLRICTWDVLQSGKQVAHKVEAWKLRSRQKWRHRE